MSLEQEHLRTPRQSGDGDVQGANSDPELVPGKQTRAMALAGARAPGQGTPERWAQTLPTAWGGGMVAEVEARTQSLVEAPWRFEGGNNGPDGPRRLRE